MKGRQKSKNLFSFTTDGVALQIQCVINENTDHIGFTTGFFKSSSGGIKNNKNCPGFLGVYIAEHILSHIYHNVKRMPYGHRGYDFICGKGYKIDVKSACLKENHPNLWGFSIKRNKIPDYFLCLAFDNREDLNPLYIWLIPGYILNNKFGTSISKSTLNKWKEYEQSINKVITCCNKCRKNKEE